MPAIFSLMEIKIEDSLYVTGDDPAVADRVKKAVEWVISTPEGREALEEAKALHKKPITIRILSNKSPDPDDMGVSVGLKHLTININPDSLKTMRFVGKNGENITASLERFFANQFKQATQPGLSEQKQLFEERIQQLRIPLMALSDAPIAQYKHQLALAQNDPEQLREIFGRMYDTHLAATVEENTKKTYERFAQDDVVRGYIQHYEDPAIAFENLLMQKYAKEPERADYLHSTHMSDMLNDSRENMITVLLRTLSEIIKAQPEQWGKTEGSDPYSLS